jgi:hypothetical protein
MKELKFKEFAFSNELTKWLLEKDIELISIVPLNELNKPTGYIVFYK